MPYIYSIRTEIYRDGIPPEEGQYKRPIRVEFNVVPQAVAEADPEGHYKLVRNDGYEVTEWQYIFSEYRAEDTTKVGTGKPLKDALGTELAGGDFVMISDTKTSKLEIAEVVSFTPQKIRVRNAGGWGEGSTKAPDNVVKVDKSLFF
jgi:hypothetical protein